MTDKLTRSEAMDKLREAMAGWERPKSNEIRDWHDSAVRCAARDLLNAEDELPWKVWSVIDPDRLLAAYRYELHAEQFVGEQHKKSRITGPTQTVDHGEDEQAESKELPPIPGGQRWAYDPEFGDDATKMVPRLVPLEGKIIEVDGKYYRIEL